MVAASIRTHDPPRFRTVAPLTGTMCRGPCCARRCVGCSRRIRASPADLSTPVLPGAERATGGREVRGSGTAAPRSTSGGTGGCEPLHEERVRPTHPDHRIAPVVDVPDDPNTADVDPGLDQFGAQARAARLASRHDATQRAGSLTG